MTERRPTDILAELYPAAARDLPVAWNQMRIPGPPAQLALTRQERKHPDPAVRYHRRTIQALDAGNDRFALVDKASPHALHDLMVSGVSLPAQPGPCDVTPLAGQLLWRTGASFVRFVSQPDVQREFGLENGRLHLALNCDPNTQDRESCQANKQFHLHLLYWTRSELAPLSNPERLKSIRDPLLRRQALDPMAFLGARLIHEVLADLPLGIPEARLLPYREEEAVGGCGPLGCLVQLPGWGVLDDCAFEALARRIHRRIETSAADILAAFTGRPEPPPPWRRHALLPRRQIHANLGRLPLSAYVRTALALLAEHLRDLPPALAERLKSGSAAVRKHHMTLNLPCYSLNLYSPAPNLRARSLGSAPEVYLIVQTKLFSGIGGAGLVSLDGVPSVRILRGEGTFSAEQWQHRARFQRAFAHFNQRRLVRMPGVRFHPVRRFVDIFRGWPHS
ncbi:MAG: hypothetical protein U9Q81_20575 [Pseudomonadota bacterium]|nr:hypothetical protein [Pseudomonadota bacterium]